MSCCIIYATRDNQPRLTDTGLVGYDLHASLKQPIQLPVDQPVRVRTDITIINLLGFEDCNLSIHPLEDVYNKTGIRALTQHVHQIAHIRVMVTHNRSEVVMLNDGDKIGQLVIHRPIPCSSTRIPLYAIDDTKVTKSGVIATSLKRDADQQFQDRVGIIEPCPSDDHFVLPAVIDVNYIGPVNVFVEEGSIDYHTGDVVAYLSMESIKRPQPVVRVLWEKQIVKYEK